MWHSIKDGEADKLFNKPTCFGQGVNYDVAAGLCSITEGICRLEWWEDESDALHHFQPTMLRTEGESDSSHSRGSFVLIPLKSSRWEVLFSQPERT